MGADQPGQANHTAAEAPLSPALVDELASLVEAAERQAHLLRRVELACVAAAESAVSQVHLSCPAWCSSAMTCSVVYASFTHEKSFQAIL